jgi:ATP adenylyltransferase
MDGLIWAPWRMEYILDPAKEPGCIFCNRLDLPRESWAQSYILDADLDVMVILNRFPYTNGHLLVLPAMHISNPSLLDPSKFCKLTRVLQSSIEAIGKALNPQGINVGMNLGRVAGAGVEDHIHFHIVPRWNGDNNFMPVIANTRVMPEYLSDTYNVLLPYFESICSR